MGRRENTPPLVNFNTFNFYEKFLPNVILYINIIIDYLLGKIWTKNSVNGIMEKNFQTIALKSHSIIASYILCQFL